MASQSQQTIIDALQRAVANPDGLPLHGNRTSPGLFASSASAKKAAQLCVDEGWLCAASDEQYTISEKGLAYLVRQTDPKPVLDVIAQSLQQRQQDWVELQSTVQRLKTSLDSFQSYVSQINPRCDGGPDQTVAVQENKFDDWPKRLTQLLTCWQRDGNLDDCPLPHLFRLASEEIGEITIGAFQDALRKLHADEAIYLHPWTGPLYELPEPNYAFMIGHEICYYVSLRPTPTAERTPETKSAFQHC